MIPRGKRRGSCPRYSTKAAGHPEGAGGPATTTVTFGGRSYAVWKTSDSHYIAFVPAAPITSGTIDLLRIFKWIIGKGWLGATATLGQICYGVEIVSTNGVKQTFTFSDFSITSG